MLFLMNSILRLIPTFPLCTYQPLPHVSSSPFNSVDPYMPLELLHSFNIFNGLPDHPQLHLFCTVSILSFCVSGFRVCTSVCIAAVSNAARLPSCTSWETSEASHNNSRQPSCWLESIDREVYNGMSAALPWATASSVATMADSMCIRSWPDTCERWKLEDLISPSAKICAR